MKEYEWITIADIKIHKVTWQDVFQTFDDYIRERTPRIVASIPVNAIIIAQRDEEFKRIIDHADLNLADSRPVLYASRYLGKHLPEFIAGSELFPAFCQEAARKGYGIFLLGAAEGVAERTASIMVEQNPGLKIVGHYSPPMGFENEIEENQKVISAIKSAKPDVLFVCLGQPKEEKWVVRNMYSYNVPVSMGIGSSFDYIGGNLKRAPKWMNKLCLEWFYRLLQEPRRLWRRYLIGNPYFVVLVIKEKLSHRIKGLPRGIGGSQ